MGGRGDEEGDVAMFALLYSRYETSVRIWMEYNMGLLLLENHSLIKNCLLIMSLSKLEIRLFP